MMLLLALASVVPTEQPFTCTPTQVWAGDGPIWCAEGPKVKLQGIAVQEFDGTCRPRRKCPSVSAVQSRDYLVGLLGGAKGNATTGHIRVDGPKLDCISQGFNPANGKTVAFCRTASIGDLSCAMIRSDQAAVLFRHNGGAVCNSGRLSTAE